VAGHLLASFTNEQIWLAGFFPFTWLFYYAKVCVRKTAESPPS
jgi:hypothetical protein